ncbi:MAG: hypothetical protein B6I28_00085 [Fusobacteriia bacterium 4572_132]|nr:MAG: hypothetical protein B6I28_00085 [Fusobacteriia bacterium 4572_132]
MGKNGMKKIIVIIILGISFFGCNNIKKIEKEKFFFGTLVKIIIYDKDSKKADLAMEKAFLEMERIDTKINGHTQKSEIDKINDNAGEFVAISDETLNLIKKAKEISKLTEGKYDITLEPIFELWNFKEGRDTLPNSKNMQEKLKLVNYEDIIINENKVKLNRKGQKLDLSSFLKGYAISRAKKELKNNGIKTGFISSISSIEVFGKKPNNELWKIGIQNPEKPTQLFKILNLTDKGIGVSGDYQTYIEIDGKKYHHILNAKTGYPIRKNKMVLIIAKNSYIADLYSTAFFTMDKEKVLNIINKSNDIEGMLIDKNMKVFYSENIKNYLKKE